MIFQHTWKQVLDGTKTQTRRLAIPEHCPWVNEIGENGELVDITHISIVKESPYGVRELWRVGKTYAVQPGRGRPCIHRRYTYNDEWTYSAGKPEGNGGKQWTPCRIRITGIRQERLQGIATVDAIAEGCPAIHKGGILYSPIDRYADLWDSIHTKPGETWADNPLVWVLEFELVR